MKSDADIVDEIDRLVDEQLAQGPVDDYSVNRYDKCQYCHDTWHSLAITEKMQEMSWYGILEDGYRYNLDTSDFLCPGSDWRGPPVTDREWKWAKKKWGRSRRTTPAAVGPTLPTGRIAIWRFSGPFDGWEISLDDTRELEDAIDPETGLRDYGTRRVLSQTLSATFDRESPVSRADVPGDPNAWVLANHRDILTTTLTPDGTFYEMAPIVIPFRSFRVDGNPTNQYPDWIEFETTYDITARHPWAAVGWERRPQAFESNYDTIDETHNERQGYVQLGFIEDERGISFTTAQAPGESERGSQVLRSRSEDSTQRDRRMAVEAQARALQEALDSAVRASFDSTEEAGDAGS